MIARKQLMTGCLMINNGYLIIARALTTTVSINNGQLPAFQLPLSVAAYKRHVRLTCVFELTT
jgi:hypothetical protein